MGDQRAHVVVVGGGEILPRRPSWGVDEGRLILIVEDDEATRRFLADNLMADGFRVAASSGAREGLRAVELRQPALLLLDLAFESGSGLELLDRVRSADGLATRVDPQLPVIVLTGRSGEADRVRSFARGADDHVVKPFHYPEARNSDSCHPWRRMPTFTHSSRPQRTAARARPSADSRWKRSPSPAPPRCPLWTNTRRVPARDRRPRGRCVRRGAALPRSAPAGRRTREPAAC